MAITNFSDLQTEVASNSNRTDLTALIPTFIQMAESEMQRELKLSEFETTASVTVTSGIGALPTGYAGARALYWDGNYEQSLLYISPDRYNSLLASHTGGTPKFYTVQANQLKVLPQGDGTVVMQYMARFTPLSASNTTNAIVTNYPDAYFFGTLMFLYHHTRNWVAKAEQKAELGRVLQSIIKDQKAKKYPGPLEVKPR